MNKIFIGQTKSENLQSKTFFVQFNDATDILAILRADYFSKIQLNLPQQINNIQLRFLMQVGRILTKQGEILVKGSNESVTKTKNILNNMGLYLEQESSQLTKYRKKQIQKKVEEKKPEKKLSIGFKAIESEQIDEDELLKNEKINLNKPSIGGCGDKVRACANCNCGRKKQESTQSKEELINSVNSGNLVSGCGKCFLGDSFRCATCPYKGLPAFKPGDKLKLVDQSQVVVENNPTVVNEGKVKIQL